jgi:agmatine deiminase
MAALDTHDILRAAGVQLDVIPEPHTRRVNSYDFLASYANFYVCNGAVITAQYGDPDTDALAQQTLARHYFDREVIMLNVDTLSELGGGIHCATQQMPKT